MNRDSNGRRFKEKGSGRLKKDLGYVPAIKNRWPDSYFEDRNLNNEKRLRQFSLDAEYIKKFKRKGNLCDVGCSTGEFLRSITWEGSFYGMEINDHARKVAEEFVSFEKNIFTEKDFFDAVVFRGTIQHVDIPFQMIKSTLSALKPGGVIIFLATPNSDSILYRLKGNLPFLDWPLNFYIPGAKELSNTLTNFGFEVLDVNFPYWHTPYRSALKDHFKFLVNAVSSKFLPHAFWGSSMNLVARRPLY